jgi:tetratricopeptide (TPR) repeat protein
LLSCSIKRLIAAAVICGLVASSFVQADPVSAQPSVGAAAQSSVSEVTKLTDQVDDLSHELRETRTIMRWMLGPITILVAVLALGGVLGVVFSVRDQRRVSQLHELTVTGEVSSQRRSEQSYGSFLEQSQTTLALVNDTLKLAKEATDQAAHSMDIKAQTHIDAIEERAQTLMLDVFSVGEFELIIADPVRRGELHNIAEELRSLEGYLSLQNIKLPDYTKFVKAIDQFILDDTEAALQALRLASQDRVVGDLQRFIEYWLGYMLTTVGEYEEAIGRFRHDEIELNEDHPEYFQLERIIGETEFFLEAKPKAQDAKLRAPDSSPDGSPRDTRGPHERFQAVAKLLDELTELAAKIDDSDDQRAKLHTSLEVTRTRADIYEWVAYDPRHLDDPIEETPVNVARDVVSRHPAAESAEAFVSSAAWGELSDPDAFRAWALMQAQAICELQKERNFDVGFALAECYFKLRQNEAAERAFASAEHAVHDEFGEHREKRKVASLDQSLLICHGRLLKLREKDEEQRRLETRQIRQASRDTREAVSAMRQGRVTVFSQIQRRNVTQDEFRAEVDDIVDQEGLRPEDE